MRPRIVLLAGLLATGAIAHLMSAATSSSMAAAASRFLGSLAADQRAQATFAIDSGELTNWHFIPTETFPRKGLTIKQMSEPQRRLAHELLKSGLSERGYLTATTIIALEDVLRVLESGGRLVRDPERYYFSVFGTPSERGTWAWRVEGHHISLHFTIVKGELTVSTPSFFGANPAEVRSGPAKGTRALAREEDSARALLVALDPARRAKALMADVAPNDIVTMNNPTIGPLSPSGLTAAEMTGDQRKLLMGIIDAYRSVMAPEIADLRLAAIRKAGVDRIGFAWAGPAERGQKHYYRVQGPTFLIEYDNTQNDANHIHSVWRDFNGDFGRDLLREHVKQSH